MPAEWETHEGTWISWPKDPLTFPSGIIEKVEAIYVKMVAALASGELVHILVDSEKAQSRVARLLGDAGNVRFHRIRTTDVWVRDYGPIFVKGRDVAATKWRFNAWGNKYDELKPDDVAGSKMAEATGLKVYETGIVLEGGSVDVNGAGACLTSEQCLLNKNRDPRRTKAQAEKFLLDYLGVSKVVWLHEGIEGDDTDGHVDDIARFVDERTVVAMTEERFSDRNHEPLARNLAALRSAKDQDGRALKVITVAMPEKSVGGEERLPASYSNFYIGNSSVLVPTFDDPNDDEALRIIRRSFPTRKAVGIDCRSLVYGFGGIHCVTQQQPESRPNRAKRP